MLYKNVNMMMLFVQFFRNLLPLICPFETMDFPVLSFDIPEAIISMPFLLSLLLLLFLLGLSCVY